MNQPSAAYSLQGEKLVFPSGATLSFPYLVAETLDCGNTIVVRLEVPPDQKLNENVFGVSYEGVIVWQVPETQHIDDNSPYTGISRVEANVGLYNWDGTQRIVTPTTGQIVGERFLK